MLNKWSSANKIEDKAFKRLTLIALRYYEDCVEGVTELDIDFFNALRETYFGLGTGILVAMLVRPLMKFIHVWVGPYSLPRSHLQTGYFRIGPKHQQGPTSFGLTYLMRRLTANCFIIFQYWQMASLYSPLTFMNLWYVLSLLGHSSSYEPYWFIDLDLPPGTTCAMERATTEYYRVFHSWTRSQVRPCVLLLAGRRHPSNDHFEPPHPTHCRRNFTLVQLAGEHGEGHPPRTCKTTWHTSGNS